MSEIEVKDSEINVEEIMKEIRSEIKRKKAAGLYGKDIDEKLNLQLFEGTSEHDLRAQLREMHLRWHVSVEKPIISDKPVIGPVIVLIKKAIRKVLRWYVNDLTNQTAAFNMHSVWAMDEIESRLSRLEQQVELLSSQSESSKSRGASGK